MIRVPLIALLFMTTGCSGRIETDDRPPFEIDPAQPFRLELGRGSGWHGLDTVRIDQNGTVVLHRHRLVDQEATWETAGFLLSQDRLAEVLSAVETNGLAHLHRAYHADVQDGTQWVLWIKQGEREKSVYFNNSFPRSITGFAEQLDEILVETGLNSLVWQLVPPTEHRKHERELWDSIKR
jgi:hypothetical protein